MAEIVFLIYRMNNISAILPMLISVYRIILFFPAMFMFCKEWTLIFELDSSFFSSHYQTNCSNIYLALNSAWKVLQTQSCTKGLSSVVRCPLMIITQCRSLQKVNLINTISSRQTAEKSLAVAPQTNAFALPRFYIVIKKCTFPY